MSYALTTEEDRTSCFQRISPRETGVFANAVLIAGAHVTAEGGIWRLRSPGGMCRLRFIFTQEHAGLLLAQVAAAISSTQRIR